jgi:uncharacterized sulfatase
VLSAVLAAAAVIASSCTKPAPISPVDGRPNVLFLVIDDVSPQRLGCYGNTICRTPHMDRFAASGIRFDNAHTSPACNASRSSVLLGLRPETSGIVTNTDGWGQLNEAPLTMPAHFRNHGYETIRCGKIFHERDQDGESWSRVINRHSGLPTVRSRPRELSGPAKDHAAELDELRSRRKGGSPFLYGPSGLDDLEESDGRVAEQAVRLLAEESNSPRLVALGFRTTHLPFTAPDAYFEMYPPEQIPLPETGAADTFRTPQLPEAAGQFNPDTPEERRAATAAHYACVSFVDAQIGRVLDALEASDARDDTIVVIWSDHGFMLGEHGRWRKGSVREQATRVVLLMRAPGVTIPGSVCSRPVESVDIFPTLFDLCGIPQPPGIEAISMRPLLEDPESEWKRAALMRHGRYARSIVTDRWRLNRYSFETVPIELFDRLEDPGELTNLAEDPLYAETIAELGALLDSGWRSCLPPDHAVNSDFVVPEPATADRP